MGETVGSTLLSEQVDLGYPVCLHCRRQIAHVGPCDGKVGIAVCVMSFALKRIGNHLLSNKWDFEKGKEGEAHAGRWMPCSTSQQTGLRAHWVSNFAVNMCRCAIMAVRESDEFLPPAAIYPGGQEQYNGEGEPLGKRKRGAMSC